MNQPSRPERRREELKRKKQARREAARALRRRQAAEDLLPVPKATIENGKSAWKTMEEEKQGRQEAAEEQLRVYRSVLPRLLKRLAKIPDPRNPLLIRHKLTVLLLYGILMFVFQMASRREANREMSLPMFLQNLQQLIRQKKFSRYLISHGYPMAIDGTQKLQRNWLWAEECLERQVQSKQEDGTVGTRPQYYVYVLEAKLVFANGMTIPLCSEFLDYSAGDQEKNKQDCELKAFYRL